MGNTTKRQMKIAIEPGVNHLKTFECFDDYIEEINQLIKAN